MAGPVAPPFSPAAANTFTALQTFSAGANITPASTPATNAAGYLGLPLNSGSPHTANYTGVIADAGQEIQFSTTGHTGTIPANSSVPYPIGAILVFSVTTGTLTVALTTDTLVFVPTNGSGSRTVTAPGFAIARKIGTTTWWIYGLGVT